MLSKYSIIRSMCLLLIMSTSLIGCQISQSFRPTSAKILQSREIARQGISAYEQGRYEDAERSLKQAMSMNNRADDITDIRRHYAETLWQLGKQQESFAQLLLLSKQRDDDIEVQNSLAKKLLEMNEPEAALKCANRVIQYVKQDYQGWASRAKAYRLLADEQAAKAENEQAIVLYKKSLADFHRSISYCENEPNALREVLPELATVQRILGQTEQELATWQTMQAFLPANQQPDELTKRKMDAEYILSRRDHRRNF